MKRKSNEVFRMLAWAWSVEHAKKLVADGREPNATFKVGEGSRAMLEYIGHESTNEIDLSWPIIAIRGAAVGFLPIDGYNRIKKALAEGVPQVDVHLLSPEEERSIRMAGCPWDAYERAEATALERERARRAAALDEALEEQRALNRQTAGADR